MASSDDTHSTLAELFAGRYTVHEPLSWNGLAIIYRAKALRGDIALAVLPLDCDGDSENGPAFHDAVRAVRAVEHPAFLSIEDAGVQLGVPFIAYEWSDAEPLSVLLERETRLPPRRALRTAQKLLEALAPIHAQGLHHGDLTPNNVLVDDATESVRVVGLGIAPLLRRVRPDVTGPTGRGSGKGAVRYLAPEVIGGARVGPAADLFSVAQLVHRMITGDPPGAGDRSYAEVPGLREVLEKATSRMTDARHADADALRRDLALEVVTARPLDAPLRAPPPSLWDLTSGSKPVARPAPAPPSRWPWVVGVFVLLAAAAIAFVLVRHPSEDDEAPDSIEAVGLSHADSPVEEAVEEEALEDDAFEDEDESPDVEYLEDDPLVESDVPADSPLAGELPPLLAETMEKIAAGYQFEQPEFRELFGWIRNHRGDVRGHLVLARAYMSRGWYTAAFERYEVALRGYEEARSDSVLRDLLEIVREGDDMLFAVWPNIRRFWGRDALPIVDEAIAAAEGRAQSDLERLRARIERLP